VEWLKSGQRTVQERNLRRKWDNLPLGVVKAFLGALRGVIQARQQLAPHAGVHLLHQGRQDREGLTFMQGVVKVYDPVTGTGSILLDDMSEVYLRPGSLEGSMFRMLRQGQRILFEIDEDEGERYARDLRFGSDGY